MERESGTYDGRGGAPRVVIVTGMSGSGKSTAMRALEDLGFFCIDNMPVPLLPRVLELTAASSSGSGDGVRPYAFAVDVRERSFLAEAGRIVEQLRAEGVAVQVIFLEARDNELVRRFSETRRRHPLSGEGTVRDGIERERALLAELRDGADALIDTTEHNVHTLKAIVQELVDEIAAPRLTITILSFGFKRGLPSECDIVYDVRFLPNPYFIDALRGGNGLDAKVDEYVMGFEQAGDFLKLALRMAEFSLPLYKREGKTYLTIGFGCTGGQHRSVAIAERFAVLLRERGWAAEARHRDRPHWPARPEPPGRL